MAPTGNHAERRQHLCYNPAGVGALYNFTSYGGADEYNQPLMTIWDGGGVDLARSLGSIHRR